MRSAAVSHDMAGTTCFSMGRAVATSVSSNPQKDFAQSSSHTGMGGSFTTGAVSISHLTGAGAATTSSSSQYGTGDSAGGEDDDDGEVMDTGETETHDDEAVDAGETETHDGEAVDAGETEADATSLYLLRSLAQFMISCRTSLTRMDAEHTAHSNFFFRAFFTALRELRVCLYDA